MARFIIYGILIYLLYLGLNTFFNKFQNFKKIFRKPPQDPETNRHSKRDLNNIEDAEYEEIKKP